MSKTDFTASIQRQVQIILFSRITETKPLRTYIKWSTREQGTLYHTADITPILNGTGFALLIRSGSIARSYVPPGF